MAAPSREATAALSLPQGAVRKTNYTSHVQHLHSLEIDEPPSLRAYSNIYIQVLLRVQEVLHQGSEKFPTSHQQLYAYHL